MESITQISPLKNGVSGETNRPDQAPIEPIELKDNSENNQRSVQESIVSLQGGSSFLKKRKKSTTTIVTTSARASYAPYGALDTPQNRVSPPKFSGSATSSRGKIDLVEPASWRNFMTSKLSATANCIGAWFGWVKDKSFRFLQRISHFILDAFYAVVDETRSFYDKVKMLSKLRQPSRDVPEYLFDAITSSFSEKDDVDCWYNGATGQHLDSVDGQVSPTPYVRDTAPLLPMSDTDKTKQTGNFDRTSDPSASRRTYAKKVQFADLVTFIN